MTDHQKPIKLITKYEEITSRPRFIEKAVLDDSVSDGVKLQDLAGYYLLKNKVKCGISSCGTQHQKGYLAVLSNGSEIILGHNCGKKYFGITFDEKENQYKHLRENVRQYVLIKETYENLERLEATYNLVINKSGRLTYVEIKNAVKAFQGDAFDYWMRQIIGREVSALGVIKREEFKSQDEIDAEKLMSNGRHRRISSTRRKVVAEIKNYDLIAKWHEADNLRDYFWRIHREIKNPDHMSTEQVKSLSKKMRNYDQNLRLLKEFCEGGNKLFTKDNLLQLRELFTKHSEILKVESFAEKFA
ncbi:hypothetical protein [Acinetobacter larvae]|uniref:Uncharacterized protein n=1 Tax=Acinetobacter larvae TaxID=1789224 RepID=A0A1B2LZ16_9GAMM|nr:hypothetical protein [Acinetobacter larvae]AOA58202.1 hypothetical protein BFG52_07460 [Acinetobacter larvae]